MGTVCCLAATFMYWQEVGNVTATSKMDKAPTDHPITFELHKKSTSDAEEERALFYTIARTELAHHGMQLLTMYL
ncbi:hypothetical protein BDN70DRAFT_329142 [Pholiota conissans]|uniref:Uncharacterized protein n=1 Tax=Pholiota conissans TaxID=109636 RepID=A0A9P6D572_9AGAR|nr:hypothetical protein BDN70DRAFT_329142 [Pholiota conissans]